MVQKAEELCQQHGWFLCHQVRGPVPSPSKHPAPAHVKHPSSAVAPRPLRVGPAFRLACTP
jgi:hypothetical protein